MEDSSEKTERKEARQILLSALISSWSKIAGDNIYFSVKHDEKGDSIPFDPRLPYGDPEQSKEDFIDAFLSFKMDEEAVKELVDYPFISLFEASILIGERVKGNEPHGVFDFVKELLSTLCHDILLGQLSPRHPDTRIRFGYGAVGIPDLTWQLSIQEVHAFAVRHWPADLFADLLESKQEMNSPMSHEEETTKLSDIKEQTLLREIGILVCLLAEKNNLFKRLDKPNSSQIATACEALLDSLIESGVFADKNGLASGSIRKHFAEGLKLLKSDRSQ